MSNVEESMNGSEMAINEDSVIEAKQAFLKADEVSKSGVKPVSYHTMIAVSAILKFINEYIIRMAGMGKYKATIRIHDLKIQAKSENLHPVGYRIIVDDDAMNVVREKLIGRGYQVNFIDFNGSIEDSCLETETDVIYIDWACAGLE